MQVFGKHIRSAIHSLFATRIAGPALIISVALLLASRFGLTHYFHSSITAADVVAGASVKAARSSLARLSQEITAPARGRGNPQINLADGRGVLTAFEGPAELAELLRQNRAQPLALAAADFDEDGAPDLVGGYSGAGSGVITLLRGNVDAIYPNSPEAQSRRATGTFTDAPFFSPALVYSVPQAPDFIGAGDFNGDGHWDVVTATRGGDRLYLLSGDGQGGLSLTAEIELPGAVTALTVGEINRRDGLEDVVVGIESNRGAQVLVYEGPEGAWRARPEVFNLAARVSALALGQLDDEYTMDLAVAAGAELVIIRGQDRWLSLNRTQRAAVAPAAINRHALPFVIRSLALGNFNGRGGTDVALLATDGTAHLLIRGERGAATRRFRGTERWNLEKLAVDGWPQAEGLLGVRVSARAGDDLIVIDPARRQLHFITGGTAEVVALDLAGEPAAVLPMRLNADALSDLVIGVSGQSALTVVATTPTATFTVNSPGDGQDSNLNDQVCNDGSGDCTLRAALEQSNFLQGTNTINFNIPVNRLQAIAPRSALPAIVATTTIDGTTQPGFSGQPLIELSGANAGVVNGLRINNVNNCVIRGLVINRFGSDGIQVFTDGNIIEGNFIGVSADGSDTANNGLHGVEISAGVDNRVGGTAAAARNVLSGNRGSGVFLSFVAAQNLVQGNFIGVDAAGAVGLGNAQGGLTINSDSNTIGGTAAGARNLISGNDRYGLLLSATRANQVQGNLIGVNLSGAVGLGNSVDGILIRAGDSNLIGGATTGAGNTIAFNKGDGIHVLSGAGHRLSGNSIFSNSGLGIELGADGVTLNDPGDPDTGANDLQNFPLLRSAVSSGASVSVQATLNSTPGAFTVEFFYNPGCDPSGYGEGRSFIGSVNVAANSSGDAIGTFTSPFPPGGFITATATDAAGNTSEFSPCLRVSTAGGPSVQANNVRVLPDLLTATGSNFAAVVEVQVNGVSFNRPALVEGGGTRVSQTGLLGGQQTIDQAIQPDVPVNITFRNLGGGETSVLFTRRQEPTPRPGPGAPLALTSVLRAGGKFFISGTLRGAPNTAYIIIFLFTDLKTDCPNPEDPKKVLGSIKVTTDDQGVASFNNVDFPDPGGEGIVNAYAIPEGEGEILPSTCSTPRPPGPRIQEITVLPDQIVARGIAFRAEVTVFVDDVGFFEPARVEAGRQVIQRGRLRDGRSIEEAIPPGRVVRIGFRNSDGGYTEVTFRN